MAYQEFKWHPCDETVATQLTASIYYPGHVYPYPVDALPAGIQERMSGLGEAYVSGYCSTAGVGSDFTALGEFAVARTDGESGKGYNYAFGVSSNGALHYAGPCKSFDEHHWRSTESTPVAQLFGHSGHYYSGGNSTRSPGA